VFHRAQITVCPHRDDTFLSVKSKLTLRPVAEPGCKGMCKDVLGQPFALSISVRHRPMDDKKSPAR